jgi:large subunit ribosomal protein L47
MDGDYTKQQLPKPAKKPSTQVVGDPNHGLWDFFRDKQLLRTPVEESQHGTLLRLRLLNNRLIPARESMDSQ